MADTWEEAYNRWLANGGGYDSNGRMRGRMAGFEAGWEAAIERAAEVAAMGLLGPIAEGVQARIRALATSPGGDRG